MNEPRRSRFAWAIECRLHTEDKNNGNQLAENVNEAMLQSKGQPGKLHL